MNAQFVATLSPLCALATFAHGPSGLPSLETPPGHAKRQEVATTHSIPEVAL